MFLLERHEKAAATHHEGEMEPMRLAQASETSRPMEGRIAHGSAAAGRSV
jgi:hypothetical protein